MTVPKQLPICSCPIYIQTLIGISMMLSPCNFHVFISIETQSASLQLTESEEENSEGEEEGGDEDIKDDEEGEQEDLSSEK